VKSIAAGDVVLADNVGTYGPTVIVQHGGGDYSVYGSLQRIDVRRGQQVNKGQSLGTVGDADPDLPPHLHFEIRPQGRAIDPLEYLRSKR
jgi:septal ring factor EnvC (AmiA/AmiB activator)